MTFENKNIFDTCNFSELSKEEYVGVFVCLSLRLHISETTWANFCMLIVAGLGVVIRMYFRFYG